MTSDDLPTDLAALAERLATFLREEVVPAEARAGVRSAGDGGPELRRWIRRRAEDLGLYRALQPAELGGGGLGSLAVAALYETVGASGTVLGEVALGGNGGLLRLGTPAQRERFLVPVLRGEVEAAFAFTDAREGPRTTAVRRGDEFVVTGVKSFVTGGPHADLLVVVAGVVDGGGAPAGSGIFVIPRETPGVTLRREFRTLDGGVHGEFQLVDVRVSRDAVIGEIGQGLPRARENISALRLRAAALACGTGRWALDEAMRQVDRPHRSGTPLADRGEIQAILADSAMDLFAARASLYAAARLADGDGEVEVAMAKAFATEAVARIVDRAIQLTGGAAVVEDHPLARVYRSIRSWRIGEGTTEALRLVVARGLLARRRAARHSGTEGTHSHTAST